MGAVPKRRTSKGRTRRRRAHQALKAVGSVVCKKCGTQRLPHRACPKCGEYK